MAGLFDGSLICARAAFAIKPSLPSIESHIESLKNAIVSRWHFAMLNDEGAFLSLLYSQLQFGTLNISVRFS